jgi:tRNA pseudouridine55 synthase
MITSEKYQLNKLEIDEFNRPSGIILLNKPAGISAHDLVNRVRAKLETKKVGHAGALDVFSSGLMLILIGKCTKYANDLLNLDKAYKARIVFGLNNYSQDPEGDLLSIKAEVLPNETDLKNVLDSFIGSYKQYVSIFSSVKVDGVKLRKALRDPRYNFVLNLTGEVKEIVFTLKSNGQIAKKIAVPRKDVIIHNIKLLEVGYQVGKDLPFRGLNTKDKFGYCDIYVKCSKGTYIRQLAQDISEKLNTVGILSQLERCELGEYSKEDVIDIENLNYSAK